MTKNYFLVMGWWFLGSVLFAQQPTDATQIIPVQRSEGYFMGDIAPLRASASEPPEMGVPPKNWEKKQFFAKNPTVNPKALPGEMGDPLADFSKLSSDFQRGNSPIFPGVNVEGLRETGATPPDPTGDIGRNHYMQATNRGGGSAFRIFDKDGKVVLNGNSNQKFWSQVGGASIGDPIVQYDHAADRWLFMEMQGFNNNELLIAISNTGDPTDGWKGYRFQTQGFPDYPKLYVWHNAYFVTVNEILDGNRASGYALERSALLTGKETFGIYRFEMPRFQGIAYQPATGADWEAGPPPPPGSPGYIFRIFDDSWGNGDADHLQVWRVQVDWQNVAASFLDGPQKIYISPFESEVCHNSLFDCIEQPGHPNVTRITALDQIIMYRVPYRNFGSYESVVLNHVADVSGQVGSGGDAAIRWYELRKNSGSNNWALAQEGTFAPDLTNRFMATITQDGQGNIGVGYSVCSEQVFPGLRVTAHRSADPPGLMNPNEYSIIEGSRAHNTLRWGDYSNLSIDPTDDRTFWFTGEYQSQQGAWGTRVMSFQLRRDTHDMRPKILEAPVASPFLSNAEKVTVLVQNEGLQTAKNVQVILKFDGKSIAQETIADDIPAGQAVAHTFQPTVDMSAPGKTFTFDLITKYALDQYQLNDSIAVSVKKLTANDAAIFGRANPSALVCSSEHPLDLIVRNAAAVPLTSLDIKYQLGGNPEKNIQWTGNLPAGGLDTVTLLLEGIKNGNNVLSIVLANPNGIKDEDRSNDSLKLKIVGNLSGSPMDLVATANAGQLNWEIIDPTIGTVATGVVNSGLALPNTLCLAEGKCFTLRLTATPIQWQGNFELYDTYHQLLVKRIKLSGSETIQFCTPTRKNIDVGVFELRRPKTGEGLSAAETVRTTIRNFGKNAATDIQIRYRIDGGAWQTENLPGTLQVGESQYHDFLTKVDFSQIGKTYLVDIETQLTTDEQPSNDRYTTQITHRAPRDLKAVEAKLWRGCGSLDNVFMEYSLENNGFETIDSFTVEIRLDGSLLTTRKHTINLTTGQRTAISYGIAVPDFQQHIFEVKITSVNGLPADDVSDNNNISTVFQVREDGFPMSGLVSLDAKPQETRLELLDELGNLVWSAGPFEAVEQFLDVNWCLDPNRCYTFRVLDSGGDGMLGSIVLQNSGGIVWQFVGQNFGNLIEFKFCTETLCNNFKATATVTPASSMSNSDGKIVVHATGGTPPYYYGLTQNLLVLDSVFANLMAGIYQIWLIDNNLCEYQITVEVKATVSQQEVTASNRQLQCTPNPTRDFVRLRLPARGDERTAIADVFDARGDLILSSRLTRWDDELLGTFSLQKQPAGHYFVRVKGLDKIYFAQIVKE